jgi:hypothetical protein
MAEQTTITRPSPIIEEAQKNYLESLRDQVQVPLDTSKFAPGVAGVSALEQAAQQQAATQAGLGTLSFDPTTGTVTGVGTGTGVGGFQPFLDAAQAATGPTAFQAFQSPYQQAVTDATLAEFDRTRGAGEQAIADAAVRAGAFGGGREGVQLAEYQTKSDLDRARLLAQLNQAGFTQAQQLAAQQFGQQAQLAQLQPNLAMQNIGIAGGIGQQDFQRRQAIDDAARQASRLQQFEAIERLGRLGQGIAGITPGGGSIQTVQGIAAPAPSPIGSALTAGLGAFSLGKLFGLEELIKKRGELRGQKFDTIRQVLPLSVLATQMGDIRTIRKPRDLINILSNLGSDPSTFKALGSLASLDLKETEGELTDKIALAKLKASKNKRFEFEKRLERADTIKKQLSEYIKQQKAEGKSDEEIRTSGPYVDANRQLSYLLREKSLKDFLFEERLKNPNTYDQQQAIKDYFDIMGETQPLAEGGRVGFQEGTPDPEFTMPEPKPREAVQDRQLDTLMKAAPALEDPNQARSMSEGDMYAALRRRLPQEITDDVVRLIAYNPEAFADFADIQDQSDVDSFNQKYNVQLVLPVENVT